MDANQHPIEKRGEDRICPNTGRQFTQVYSAASAFDSCDQCRPSFARVTDYQIKDSDSDYHKNQ